MRFLLNLAVDLGERSYNITIASSILTGTGSMIKKLSGLQKVLLVSNPTVYALYGEMLYQSLNEQGFKVRVALMPDGEQYKTVEHAMKVLDQAVEARLERNSIVVALGGGVVGDLAGFVAAVYHRGIGFVQIPTTLLAQVDSSVGGKVAVNHALGKNMIGAFYQPRLVVIDIDTLRTLEARELIAGMGEVVKYGIVYDADFFAYLEEHAERIIAQDQECLQHVIYQCCHIKSAIVEKDETEQGLRAILNLGHTFGHSLEKLGGYHELRHGEAVAMGTMAAAYLAEELGYLTGAEVQRIQNLYRRLGLETLFPPYDPVSIYEGMQNDKKISQGRLRMVLPDGIGAYVIKEDLQTEMILAAIRKAGH